MEWQPGDQSQDIEDRRGEGGGFGGGGGGGFNIGGGGIGIGVFLIVAVISLLTGRNFLPLLFSGGGGGSAPSVSRSAPPRASSAAETHDVQLINVVLDDAQQRWAQIFQQSNLQYRHAKLVLFRDSTYSGCGTAQASTGPFYCPQDEKIYIDLGFWDELRQMGGNTGDFAQSYVVTHELGHHIQKLLGIEAREQRLAQSSGEENPLSVDLELQADCFAGVWGHASAQRFKLDQNDLAQALQSAAAVGDDHLQKMSGRAVSPESWTHGSSAQRQQWFSEGFQNGNVKGCATFNGKLAP